MGGGAVRCPRGGQLKTHHPVELAIRYWAATFAIAFAFGVVRTLVIAPRFGELGAVCIELPLILTVSWLVAGFLLRRHPLTTPGRAVMGGLAFALLMASELALAIILGGSLASWLTALGRPVGLLGLAGQIGFALIPLIRRRGD